MNDSNSVSFNKTLIDSSNNNIKTTDISVTNDFILNERSIKNIIETPSTDINIKNANIDENIINPSICQSSSTRADVVIELSNESENLPLLTSNTNTSDITRHLNESISSDIGNEQSKGIRIYDSEEEFERNLPKTVTILNTPFGSKVYLVGTAHFSEESQNDVSFVIQNVRPNIVMVELCPARIHILNMDEKTLLEETKNFNLAKINNIIKQNGYINGIFFILLLHMSAQLAKELGMAPGGEFRRAFSEIKKIPGCLINLGDRPINITLQRALRALSFWQTIKLVWRVAFTESISIKEVEECKQRDLLEKLMAEMAGEFPAFSDVFVKERDLYLCHSLQVAALPVSQGNGNQDHFQPLKVVGVVGIGHAAGIAQNWGKVKPEDIPTILNIPPASIGTRAFKISIKYGLIGCTLYAMYKVVKPIFI